jgi:IS30 family transposase
MKHKKFTQTERTLLSQWRNDNVGKKECARRPGRDIRTIQREIIRNKTRVAVGDNDWEMIYEPVHAQHVAMQRKQHAFLAKQPLKNKKIFSYVLRKLKTGWSPEQIAGRLREVDHPNEKDWHICMETICQFVYKKKNRYDQGRNYPTKYSGQDKTGKRKNNHNSYRP